MFSLSVMPGCDKAFSGNDMGIFIPFGLIHLEIFDASFRVVDVIFVIYACACLANLIKKQNKKLSIIKLKSNHDTTMINNFVIGILFCSDT